MTLAINALQREATIVTEAPRRGRHDVAEPWGRQAGSAGRGGISPDNLRVNGYPGLRRGCDVGFRYLMSNPS